MHSTSDSLPPRILALNASPRSDGNSSLLLDAAVEGARSSGAQVERVHLADYVTGVLDDCRFCRDGAGECTIPDRYRELLLTQYAPADGLLVASPLHYYGAPSRLKAFVDRFFCYSTSSSPEHERFLECLPGKRIGLIITSEETYPSSSLGFVQQMQETARYNRQVLVGVVHAHGNARGDIVHDPTDPRERARQLGERLMTAPATDYQFDTVRGHSVWTGE